MNRVHHLAAAMLILAGVTFADTITVFGSSVASGQAATNLYGYAARLGDALDPAEWTVVNKSIGGNTTQNLLDRFDADLLPTHPRVVIIGLSLANEGISGSDPDAVWERYYRNMQTLISRSQDAGIHPVIGLCYPRADYTEQHYQYILNMNIALSAGTVPSINFLGALDDGAGHWAPGSMADGWHPNDLGHEQMYLSIVPTLFDALRRGKPRPQIADTADYLSLGNSIAAPLSYTPADSMHSFAQSFWFRTTAPGTLGAIEEFDRSSLIEVTSQGLVYTTAGGQSLGSTAYLLDNQWHHVTLSHRYLPGQMLLFVDGEEVGMVSQQLSPQRFVLGGPGDFASDAAAPATDYRAWSVYRSALTDDEVRVLHVDTMLLQASLEVYAPFSKDAPERNTAQSLAILAYEPDAVVARSRMTPLAGMTASVQVRVDRTRNQVQFACATGRELPAGAIEVFSMQGRSVGRLVTGTAAGRPVLATAGWPAGTYLVRFTGAQVSQTASFTLVR